MTSDQSSALLLSVLACICVLSTANAGDQIRFRSPNGKFGMLLTKDDSKLIEIKSDCIMLEGVVCEADYHRFCTRKIYSYWREIWLERVDAGELDRARPPEAGARLPCG